MAAGKSTVAQLLAERLPRAVHVRGDVFRRMVVSGRVEIGTEENAEGAAQLWLRYRLSAMVADEYARAGFVAIVQDIVLGPELARYGALVTARPRYLVVLAPRPTAVAARERSRPKRGYGDWTVDALDRVLREKTPRLGLWLDTSDQAPAETVDEIQARLSEALLR